MKNKTVGKWQDPEYRREYNQRYREKRKENLNGVSAKPPLEEETPLSPWKRRIEDKNARERASQVHPLMLPGCPSCGGEFFRKFNGQYEPMKLDSCNVCGIRFYYAGGAS